MGSRIKRLAETWDNRCAVAYSNGQRSFGVELSHILAKRDWKIADAASSSEATFLSLTLGKAALLIIDDTEADPAASIQRQQLFHPLACLTPTLIFASKHSDIDLKCMQSMGEAVILAKPISPNTVLEAIDQLCERWSQGYLAELRRIAVKLVEGQTQSAYRMLTDIVQGGGHTPLATAALALYYRQQDDIKMTEKLLISAIKQGSFEMITILPLIDLYLYAGAPSLALRLIEMAFSRFESPNFLCVDAIQALTMLNRIKDCLPYLQQLADNDYFADLARHYLPRIYYSCGELDQFDKSIRYKPEKFDDYQRSWHLLADEDADRRKAQYEHLASTKKQNVRQEKSSGKGTKPAADQNPSVLGKPLFSAVEKIGGA